MSIEAAPSDRGPRSGIKKGIQQEDPTWSESSALLRGLNADEEAAEVEEPWSTASLGPGFIWIETGLRHLHHFKTIFNPPSNLLQRLPLRL
jgi:hypothetical protein